MAGALYEPQVDIRGQGHKVLYGTAPPAAASDAVGEQFNVGDVIINIAPTPGTADRWVCTTASTAAVPQGVWYAHGVDGSLTFTLTNAQVLTMFSAPTLILGAQGPGTVIEVISMLLENVFVTGAYLLGGAIQLSYGANVTVPATATIAATFLTSPVANQTIKVAGLMNTQLSSAVQNTGLYIAAATQDFTTGAGNLIGKLMFRVHSGM